MMGSICKVSSQADRATIRLMPRILLKRGKFKSTGEAREELHSLCKAAEHRYGQCDRPVRVSAKALHIAVLIAHGLVVKKS